MCLIRLHVRLRVIHIVVIMTGVMVRANGRLVVRVLRRRSLEVVVPLLSNRRRVRGVGVVRLICERADT